MASGSTWCPVLRTGGKNMIQKQIKKSTRKITQTTPDLRTPSGALLPY